MQFDIPEAPTYHPTAAEFKDPFTYIMKIYSQASKYGICRIIPPKGWDPPFALEKGTNGSNCDSFKFVTRRQFTSHLCVRVAAEAAEEEACSR